MPLSRNGGYPDSKNDDLKSWAPEEFTSVPRSSLFSPRPTSPTSLEPITLEKIGWSQELTSFLKPPADNPEEAAAAPQTTPKNVTAWQMPEISQFAAREKVEAIAPAEAVNQPGVNTAIDYAARIREDAEKQAAEILEAARVQAAEIEAESLKQADERRQQGYVDGMEACREEAAAILKTAGTVLEEAHRWKQQVMDESEPAVIGMIKSISQDLFGEGYILNVHEIEAVITRAISQASRLGDLRIYMNPEDAMQIISLWQESEIILNGQKIALVSSQNIERGGCFIDGQYGMVDSRVSEQLTQIHKALDSALADSAKAQEQ